MNEEILRIKRDLETITAAAGLEKPPINRRLRWICVGLSCINGLLGLILAVCAWLDGVHLPLKFIGASYLILSLVEAGWIQYAYLLQPKRTPAMERTDWKNRTKYLILLGLSVYFFYWLKIDDMGELIRVVLMFMGVMIAVVAMGDKQCRCFWGAAILFLIAGMAAPEIPKNINMQLAFVMLTFAVAQLLMAALIAWQLREFEK